MRVALNQGWSPVTLLQLLVRARRKLDPRDGDERVAVSAQVARAEDATVGALADELQFIKKGKFSGTAGEVRFAEETLSLDIDGDGTADFAVALPGVTKLKGSNLLL